MDRNPAQEGIDAAREDARHARHARMLHPDLQKADRDPDHDAVEDLARAIAHVDRRRAAKTCKASRAYRARLAAVRAQIERLTEVLDEHQDRQAASPKNWGFAGDLGAMEATLQEILDTHK